MTLKNEDWRVYACLRSFFGKEKAEGYKQECFKRYKKYGSLLQSENKNNKFVYAFGDFDSYCLKCFTPCHFSEIEKDDICNEIEIPFYNSPYDCTGQKFTIGIDFYKVHNGTWIYHHIGIDI